MFGKSHNALLIEKHNQIKKIKTPPSPEDIKTELDLRKSEQKLKASLPQFEKIYRRVLRSTPPRNEENLGLLLDLHQKALEIREKHTKLAELKKNKMGNITPTPPEGGFTKVFLFPPQADKKDDLESQTKISFSVPARF